MVFEWFGTIPMTGLLLAFALLLLIGVLKGSLGFGAGLLAVPLVVQVFPPKIALAAITLPLWLNNVVILSQEGVPWQFLRENNRFFVATIVGVIIGVFGFVSLPIRVMYLVLAAYLVVFLVFDRRDAVVRSLAQRQGSTVLAGGLGGLIAGAIVMGGPVFVSYLHARRVGKTQFVSALALIFTVTLFARIASLYTASLFSAPELLLGVSFALPLFAGVVAGTHLRGHIPQRAFELFVRVLLVGVAVNLALSGLRP